MEDKKPLIIIISVIVILILLYFFIKKTGVFNREPELLTDVQDDVDTLTTSETTTHVDTNTGTQTATTAENQIMVINPNGASVYYQRFLHPETPYIPTYTIVNTLPVFPNGKLLTFIGQKLTDTSVGGKYFYETTEPTNVTGHPEMSNHLFVRAEDVKVI